MVAREWEKEARRLRRAIEALGRRSPTERIPRSIRERVVGLVDRGRAAGMRWRELGVAVGLSVTTIERWWTMSRRTTPALVPVEVEVEPLPVRAASRMQGELSVVSANGFRIEGLDVTAAIEVLRALG